MEQKDLGDLQLWHCQCWKIFFCNFPKWNPWDFLYVFYSQNAWKDPQVYVFCDTWQPIHDSFGQHFMWKYDMSKTCQVSSMRTAFNFFLAVLWGESWVSDKPHLSWILEGLPWPPACVLVVLAPGRRVGLHWFIKKSKLWLFWLTWCEDIDHRVNLTWMNWMNMQPPDLLSWFSDILAMKAELLLFRAYLLGELGCAEAWGFKW